MVIYLEYCVRNTWAIVVNFFGILFETHEFGEIFLKDNSDCNSGLFNFGEIICNTIMDFQKNISKNHLGYKNGLLGKLLKKSYPIVNFKNINFEFIFVKF